MVETSQSNNNFDSTKHCIYYLKVNMIYIFQFGPNTSVLMFLFHAVTNSQFSSGSPISDVRVVLAVTARPANKNKYSGHLCGIQGQKMKPSAAEVAAVAETHSHDWQWFKPLWIVVIYKVDAHDVK